MKWALLFGVTMLACGGLFLIAPFCGWWLPEGVSSHAKHVDFLFYVILGITTFFFILTEAVLVIFMARYAADPEQPGAKYPVPAIFRPIGNLLNNQHKVEMAWTIVPAAILLYIAFAQIPTWANIKYQSHRDQIIGENVVPVQVGLSARQFEWRFRYPSPERFRSWLNKRDDAAVKADMKSFGTREQFSDVHTVNDLHVYNEYPAVVHVSTIDVIHSFNLPQFRIKQDALPGKLIPVWFKPIKANVDAELKYLKDAEDREMKWEIPCAELCGWGHGRMIGRVYVHPDEKSFLKWLDEAYEKEHSKKAPSTSASAK